MRGKTSAVAPRRKARLALLFARTSARLRASVALATVLSAASKLIAVLVALRVADGDLRMASVLGAIGFATFAAFRVVSSGVRVDAEVDLHRALTRVLLEGDVLSSPTERPLRTVFELGYFARALVTETAPELVASCIAAFAVAPLLVSTLPARVLLVGGLVLVVVIAALAVLGRFTAALQRRVSDAQERVFEHVDLAVGGRLELVARGAENETMRAFDAITDRYRAAAKQGAWRAALLGRAPLAAGLAAVVVLIVLDTSYREAVTAAVLGRALVLAACLPILFGVVFRANELVRLSAMVSPVLDVLEAPSRTELARQGDELPPLPATIAARDVTFSYGGDGAPALDKVSFEWSAGSALVVEGPNGAGKSTLFRLVLGLRLPQSGTITVGGKPLATLDLTTLRRNIAYLPQRPYLGEAGSTVRSVLGIIDGMTDDAAMRAAVERVGLTAALSAHAEDLLDTPIGELSVGQRQRLALARILLQNASIYLLDEPDANLDRAGIALVTELVADLLARGRMVAIAAHSADLATIPGTRVTLA